MIGGWAILALSLGYVGLLFALAYYGDRRAMTRGRTKPKPIIYSLSLAIYCTSWTFYGSVGLAASTGYKFLAIYIGPILVFALGWPLLRRIIRISKSYNITSIADFLAARYGKSQWLAATVTAIAAIGTLPYIALQLKAVSTSFTVLVSYPAAVELTDSAGQSVPAYTALAVALLLALFAALFGTRHIDATEHNEGMILAIAFDSIVKLVAFVAVGALITWGMFDGFGDLIGRVRGDPSLQHIFINGVDGTGWVTMTGLATAAILCLPRQFHVTVVENTDLRDLYKATWLFPVYLVAINIFVVPIAIAGLSTFPGGTDGDMFVLALPVVGHHEMFAVLAFIGGLSAATGMVIVSSVAVSNMVSNNLVMPVVLHRRRSGAAERGDMGRLILRIRRASIFTILMLGFCCYLLIADSLTLASIGLLSFAAVAQFAPPLLGGLLWHRANVKGALAGVIAGFLIWTYTLLLPSIVQSGWAPMELLQQGPFGLALLRPQQLFGLRFDPLTHGVFWSLFANVGCLIVVSYFSSTRVIERIQARTFIESDPVQDQFTAQAWHGSIQVSELAALVSRYLGADRMQRNFAEFAMQEGNAQSTMLADFRQVRQAEHLLASAIGAPSARLVMALALERQNLGIEGAMQLLDDATVAIQYNRDLLQSTLENVRQGISVFDRELRLVCRNRQFRDLLDLPPALTLVGVSLEEIVRFNASRGEYGPGDVDKVVAARLELFVTQEQTAFQWRRPNGTVLDVRTSRMPSGSYVTTYSEVTEHVQMATELAATNELLEQRVLERTVALTALNAELRQAKVAAEEANLGKTRFLAAASHDLLQPLNAARLYVSSLIEQQSRGAVQADGADRTLAQKVDTSLGAVEEILEALLDISRLDAGKLTAERQDMRLSDLFATLRVEFAPLAERKGLDLRIVPTSLAVNSDRRLLRRILQNLLSNAIRYTPAGKVLMGVRQRGGEVSIEIHDTGSGIPVDKQDLVFGEFQRFAVTPGTEPGVGLGLSIVDRIARVLDHPVVFRSVPGQGTMFALRLPRGVSAIAPLRTRATPALPMLEQTAMLCIDNEPSVLDGMRMLLEGWGCRPLLASGLSEAISLCGAVLADLDLIIVDYHLDAEADGLRCVEVLREHSGVALPAILITADRSAGVRAAAAAKGLYVLNKPIKPAALRALVSRVIATRQAAE